MSNQKFQYVSEALTPQEKALRSGVTVGAIGGMLIGGVIGSISGNKLNAKEKEIIEKMVRKYIVLHHLNPNDENHQELIKDYTAKITEEALKEKIRDRSSAGVALGGLSGAAIGGITGHYLGKKKSS